MKSMDALCFWRKKKKKLLTNSTFLMPGSGLINIIPNDITFPKNSLESDLRAEPLSLRITNYCLLHFLLSWIKIIHLQFISKYMIVLGPRVKEEAFPQIANSREPGLFKRLEDWAPISLAFICLKTLSEEAVQPLPSWPWVPGSVSCFQQGKRVSFKAVSRCSNGIVGEN